MNKCPVCDSKNIEVYFTIKEYVIKKCSDCGLGATENTTLQSDAYHRDDQYIQEEELFRNIFQKRVNIVTKLLKPGKVLEVGCSTGLLLSLLQSEGWEVCGIEPSRKAAEVAIKRGINTVLGTFETIKFVEKFVEKFDLIIFNHVLEHVENPKFFLKKCQDILNPNGTLLISLPNFNSVSARIQKKNWPLLLPSEHLWHFTPRSLKILLEKLNFQIIYEEEPSGIWDYGSPLYGLWQSFISCRKRFFIEFVTAVFDLLLTLFKSGSGIIVLARKR